MELEILKPFGPSIIKVKIPEKIVLKLNNYIDQIVINKKKSLKLDYGDNLVGDVTQEFTIEKNMMEKSGWGNFLMNCTSEWIKQEFNKNITKFIILNSWIVRQFKNEYNPTHWHSGHISGAGFLKVPKDLGKHYQNKENKKEYRGGNLQLIHGSRMFSSKSTMNIKPEVGDFYFFPNYLMHTVFPFKGTDEERRSISFNAKIDENIYNVYES